MLEENKRIVHFTILEINLEMLAYLPSASDIEIVSHRSAGRHGTYATFVSEGQTSHRNGRSTSWQHEICYS